MTEKQNLSEGNYLIVKNSSQSSLWPGAGLSHPGCNCMDNFFEEVLVYAALALALPGYLLPFLLNPRAEGNSVGYSCPKDSTLIQTGGEKVYHCFFILLSLS